MRAQLLERFLVLRELGAQLRRLEHLHELRGQAADLLATLLSWWTRIVRRFRHRQEADLSNPNVSSLRVARWIAEGRILLAPCALVPAMATSASFLRVELSLFSVLCARALFRHRFTSKRPGPLEPSKPIEEVAS